MTIKIDASLASKVGFASHQNAVPILRELELDNISGESFEDLILTLSADPGFLQPKTWRIDRLAAGTMIHITDRDVSLNADLLGDLDESLVGTISLHLKAGEETLAEVDHPVELLARNQWGGVGSMAELLPAFVMPNDPAVDRVLKAASDVLRRAGRPDGINGYEDKSRTRVWELTSAIWSAVCGFRISYALPPAHFEGVGQKVRTPSAILDGGLATCLDTALLFAAALEQARLNPLIIITQGHAFTGVWLQPVEFAALATDEAAALRRRIDLKDMIVFETTLATQAHPPGLSQAEKVAQRLIAEDAVDPFEIAIDVRRARMQKIRPLSTSASQRAEINETDVRLPVSEAMEAAPQLPDFDVEVPEEADTVRDRIALWQRKLLNLTTSNRLLHVPDGAKVVRLLCPDPHGLEDRLATGRKVRIVPMPDLASGGRDEKLYETQTNENLREQVAHAALERGEALSLLPKDRLEAGLIDLYRKARSDLAEGGANTLFLALGFLKWKKRPEDERSYRAPLILIPVKLERKSALSGVVMTQHEDEPRFNLTLLELLRQDFELTIPNLHASLPADETGVDVEEVWNIVRRAVRDMPGFEVVPDVLLGTFSFAKYLMWKDLVDRADQLKESPVVRHLIEREGNALEGVRDFPRPDELDDKVAPESLFTPLPADSSQLAAVLASAEGHNFVLDGPPGTGKSQTIANIIAQNLALGRRVLFVAEKMAALDVVQRRLEKEELGEFCLELHSAKATKVEVLKQLDRAWTTRDTMSAEEWAREAAEARRLRDGLNDVVRLLHRREANGLTLHRAIGRVVRDWTDHTPRLFFAASAQHDDADMARFREVSRRLGLARRDVHDLPASLGILTASDWSNGWQEAISAAARTVLGALRSALEEHENLKNATKLPSTIHDKAELESLLTFVNLLIETHGRDVRLAFAPDMADRIAATREAIIALEQYRAEEAGLSAGYAPEASRRIDLTATRANWQAAGERFWFLATLAKRKVARALGEAGGATGVVDPENDLPRLEKMAGLLEELDKLAPRLAGVPGWVGLASDTSAVEAACAFLERLRAAIAHQADGPDHLAELRRVSSTLTVDANDLLGPDGAIVRCAGRLSEAATRLGDAIDVFSQHAAGPVAAPYEVWRTAAEAVVAHEARLQSWTNWQRARHDAVSQGLSPLVEAVETGIINPEDVLGVFETAYSRWFAACRIDAEPLLRQFASSVHGDNIQAFRQLDDRLSKLSARYIRAKLCGQIPAKETIGKRDGYAVLKHQLQLKQRHKPIRQLAIEMGDAFTRLAPCMLMSPLSIAQYLPPDQALFDLVIFDEASQITPWDAIGAMARGKQVVIAGDPRQMPPTSFFMRSANATDTDMDTEEDMESILDECLAAGVPMHSLSWHYRSRHESLIAFSNHRYYDSGLVTFPSPETRPSTVGWRRVEGVYARGKGRTNQIEAKAMVDEAVRRLTDPGFVAAGHTLGIITLNADQQKLVEDLLDQARRSHPKIEPHFSDDRPEPVVVKNLETVQGDERDLIMLGIGFGPTEPGAKTMSMSFGALNAQGGWRRLNVAVTRARREMLVFTSFDPGMIDLHRTSARAVADLKHFLEFADRGPRALAEAVTGSVGGFDSPFEEAVAAELTRRGWIVVPQIGVSRFRIDIGIVHPDRPGDYLVGIECDGAAYHSAATARDRDKVRAAILQDLGWRLLRVWSTDWWMDKSGAADRLHHSIEELLEQSRSEQNTEPLNTDNGVDGEARKEAPAQDEPNASELIDPNILIPLDLMQAPDSSDDCRYRVTNFSAHLSSINPDVFYEDSYDPTLAAMIEHVLGSEAPIAESLLVQRIARAHGFQRSGRIIRERVMRLASRRHHVSDEQIGEPFLWPDAETANSWRACRFPATEGDIRQVEEIALQELAAAAQDCRYASDVPVEVARKFGIRRLSASARRRIEAALSQS